jgi:hypothetical protein
MSETVDRDAPKPPRISPTTRMDGSRDLMPIKPSLNARASVSEDKLPVRGLERPH